MNGFAVQDEWVKYAQQQRRGNRPSVDDSAKAASELRAKAAAWVAENLPDLAGCPFAMAAAIDVKASGQQVTASLVRRRRSGWRLPSGGTLAELEAEITSEVAQGGDAG